MLLKISVVLSHFTKFSGFFICLFIVTFRQIFQIIKLFDD